MRYTSLGTFFFFGTCLRYLQDVRVGTPVKGNGYIIHNINSFYKSLEDLELQVTKRVANRKLRPILDNLESKDENYELNADEANELTTVMATVRTTLEAELAGVGAYIPTPKRLDINRLLGNVSELFAPGVYEELPEVALYDFEEAGKCIAYELPTAAAFHILRATEDILRFYYKHMVRQNRISSTNWGPIVNDLRVRTRTKKYDALNNHLDNIRHSFRNPTQHPEAIFDLHEVQDLWSLCVDVVNRMIKTLWEEGKI